MTMIETSRDAGIAGTKQLFCFDSLKCCCVCAHSYRLAPQPFYSPRRCGSGFLLFIGTVSLRKLTVAAATRFAFEDGY